MRVLRSGRKDVAKKYYDHHSAMIKVILITKTLMVKKAIQNYKVN